MRWPATTEVVRIGAHALRRVVPADVPAIQALFESDPAFFTLTEGAPPRPDEAHQQLVEEPPPPLGEDSKHAFVVHAPDGELAAFVDVLHGFPDAGTWYLGLIFLAPAVRGAGLGSALLESLCAHTAAVGGTAVRLAVVVTHTRARRLYDRHGFAFVARRKRTTWNGAVIEVDVLERRVA